MIANGQASILDQDERGDTILSMAAVNGKVETCKWLLDEGAPTEHFRFGSVLTMVLNYGGNMYFENCLPLFEIIRLLHDTDDFDIREQVGLLGNHFSGPKEVFSWLIEKSQASSYKWNDDDFVHLALAISTGHHNSPELIRMALSHIIYGAALDFKDSKGYTLLNHVCRNIGYLHNDYFRRVWFMKIKVGDEGFNLDKGKPGSSIPSSSYQKWRSILYTLPLSILDIHTVSPAGYTPLKDGLQAVIFYWDQSDASLHHKISQFLEVWLLSLCYHKICLVSYGEKEKQLQEEGLVDKDFHRLWKYGSNWRIFSSWRLIGFTPSASPYGWKLWWSEPTDVFAGDFWRMCEREPTRMPGAWDDSFD